MIHLHYPLSVSSMSLSPVVAKTNIASPAIPPQNHPPVQVVPALMSAKTFASPLADVPSNIPSSPTPSYDIHPLPAPAEQAQKTGVSAAHCDSSSHSLGSAHLVRISTQHCTLPAPKALSQ